LLITNRLCVFMGIHGLFWVGGFSAFRMLRHVETPFCVERAGRLQRPPKTSRSANRLGRRQSVWNGTGFLSLFLAGLKPGLHMADSSMAFVQNLAGCLPISRSEWW
jgi:hypothetical protein